MRTLGLALVWLVALLLPVFAQDGATSLDRLAALDLPRKDGALTLYYSPSAEAEAATYAEALEKAVAWYRARTGWTGDVVMAVLDRDDWAAVSPDIPYPSPHAELRTGLVLMPDRIDDHPGFDQWDLEPVGLNAALTFHEIGHVIAHDLGIWSGNYWINELVANAFLAAYVRAEAPRFAGLLAGVPPRFTDFGPYTALVDFDRIYYAMGALNYAWFQFRIAALADYLVAGRDFGAVAADLRRAFPIADEERVEPLAATFEKLERIRPGITARAADLLGESGLPLVATVPCGPEPKGEGAAVPIVIENRSDAPVSFNTLETITFALGIALLRGEIDEADIDRLAREALATTTYADTLAPGQTWTLLNARAGTQWYIVGGDCFIVPDRPSRFVWAGG